MSNTSARNDPPETGGADLDHVTEHGQNIIDSLRWKFASSGKMQRGDFYMDQSLGLLQRILPVLGPLDQKRLWATYTRLVQTDSGISFLLMRNAIGPRKQTIVWRMPATSEFEDFSKPWNMSVAPRRRLSWS
jgi:hypothetical protein